MSVFVGSPGGIRDSFLLATDEQVSDRRYKWDGRADAVQMQMFAPGALWSSSRFCGGGGGWGPTLDDMGDHRWDTDLRYSGGQQALKLTGTTRDSAGAVLGSCVVEGFVTATDASIGKVTSDTAGYFELPSSAGAVAHYLVAYKSGSPDVAGTTKNNLVPS